MRIAHVSDSNPEDYFFLYIPLRDKIRFESKLIAEGMQFYVDEKYTMPENDMRYIMKREDFIIIETIMSRMNIRLVTDNEVDERPVNISVAAFYFKVALVFILVFVLAVLVFELFFSVSAI